MEAELKGKNGFEFRARNELTTKRKSRKGEREGRYRAGEPHSLMTREARGARGAGERNDFNVFASRRDDYSPSLSSRAFLYVSRRFFRDDILRASISLRPFAHLSHIFLFRPRLSHPLVPFGILGVNVSFLPTRAWISILTIL